MRIPSHASPAPPGRTPWPRRAAGLLAVAALLGWRDTCPAEAGDATTPGAGPVDAAAAFFDEGRRHEVRLTFTPGDLATLEATAPRRRLPLPPGGAGPAGPRPEGERRPDGERRPEGEWRPVPQGPPGPPPAPEEFTFVPARLTIDDGASLAVAVRWKGNSSYQAAQRHGKKSWKVDLDREVAEQSYLGLDKLNLQNATADSTLMRESVAYELYRRFQVPAARTTFARVTQAVEGGGSRVLGTYTVVEQVDAQFLTRVFGTPGGLLLKPERAGDLRLRGAETPEQLAQRLGVKREGTDAERKALHALLSLLSVEPAERPEGFEQRLAERLDVEAVLRWWAMATLLGDVDTLAGMGHNAYLYVRPSDQRLVIIPWDLNHAFGAMPMTSVEQAVAWSIDRPWTGSKRLFEHLMATPAWKARFRALLAEALATVFQPSVVRGLVERRAAALREGFAEPESGLTRERWETALTSDVERGPLGPRPDGARPPGPPPEGPRPEGARPEGPGAEGPRPEGPRPEGARPEGPRPEGPRPGPFPGKEPGLLSFVERRAAHVTRQLAGEVQGEVLTGPGGPGGRGPRPPAAGRPGDPPLPPPRGEPGPLREEGPR